MVFWGVEIKPGKPFTYKSGGGLHISQATLGFGTSDAKTVLQCNVGDLAPILLCCLLPNRLESCHVDLQFQELDPVVFSVVGPRSIHLSGYFLSNHGGGACQKYDDDTDSFGEDIADTETDGSETEDENDYDYEDNFIDDKDIHGIPSPLKKLKRKKQVVKEKHSTGYGDCKHLKRNYKVIDSDDDLQKQFIVQGRTGIWDSDSESQINDVYQRATKKPNKKIEKGARKEQALDVGNNMNHNHIVRCEAKEKLPNANWVVENLEDSILPSTALLEVSDKPKRKHRNRFTKKKTVGAVDESTSDIHNVCVVEVEPKKVNTVDMERGLLGRDNGYEEILNDKKVEELKDCVLPSSTTQPEASKKPKKKSKKPSTDKKSVGIVDDNHPDIQQKIVAEPKVGNHDNMDQDHSLVCRM